MESIGQLTIQHPDLGEIVFNLWSHPTDKNLYQITSDSLDIPFYKQSSSIGELIESSLREVKESRYFVRTTDLINTVGPRIFNIMVLLSWLGLEQELFKVYQEKTLPQNVFGLLVGELKNKNIFLHNYPTSLVSEVCAIINEKLKTKPLSELLKGQY